MNYIDETKVEGYALIQEMRDRVQILKQLDLIEKLKPDLLKEGNQMCFIHGDMPNDCIVGFGDTAAEAMENFHRDFYNGKPLNPTKLS